MADIVSRSAPAGNAVTKRERLQVAGVLTRWLAGLVYHRRRYCNYSHHLHHHNRKDSYCFLPA
jgi:hypothetical protein